ncbi:MAG TPA: YtxH domain-containing protein [Anaerolineales bacterium]|nr:YtxH domain-containing protein [Anaerolineales bacterium]
MSERDEFGAFLVGFIVGGLTGAIAALLFAPQSGEETRTLLAERGIELKDQATQTSEDALARAEAIAEEAKARVAELQKKLRRAEAENEVLEEAMQEAEEKTEEA